MIRVRIFITMLFCVWVMSSSAQVLQLNHVQVCAGDTAVIDIQIPAMDSVGAITLFVEYDTNIVNFIGIKNLHSQAGGTIFNDMHSGGGSNGARLGKIGISWVASFDGISFNAGVLGSLEFEFLLDSCNISFGSNCELVHYNTLPINVTFSDGSIAEYPEIIILKQPDNQFNKDSANFKVEGHNINYYQWQAKTQVNNNWHNLTNGLDYSGVNSDSLSIRNAFTNNLNWSYYRCEVQNQCDTLYSDSASLIFTSIDESEDNPIAVYPNPFQDEINVDLKTVGEISSIAMYNSIGKRIDIIQFNKHDKIQIKPISNLHSGIYFLEIRNENGDKKNHCRIKLLKL